MKRRTAFTLVELLVVIAIIALLMGILMPALSKVRRMAKATVCRTSVRQWGLIFKLYGEDNDAKLPQSIAGGHLRAQEAYFIVATLPYYKDKGIRICPSTKVVRTPQDWSHGGTFACWGPFLKGGPDSWYADFDTGSYGINDWCATPPPGELRYWDHLTENAWKTQLVKGADRIPLFGDSVFCDYFPVDGQTQGTPLSTEPPPYDGWNMNTHGTWNNFPMRLLCLPRHDGAVNFVFLDGSVGAVPLRALWKLKWHRNFNINGYWTTSSAPWPQWLQKFGDEYH